MATVVLLLALLDAIDSGTPTAMANPEFGYGFNVAAWDVARLQAIGFNWMKVFNDPDSRLPVNVLRRVDANANHLGNLPGFGQELFQKALAQKGFIDAYEIGNEPNLDAGYGWAASPNAADYATLLCEAHTSIKAADPDAVVISAGLAPTGRVQGNWNGHPGHNGAFQDEREFLKEFLAAGGDTCLDGVGYHPYGFSADYDAEPDVASANPSQNCANGFCFRGVEKIYQLMQASGIGNTKVWATEYGWIVEPPQHCLSDPSWSGRLWQIVSEEKQASNLVGSFQYATANWPWMEAMFVFNLNFNTSAGLAECDQMRFYAVEGRPAESDLTNMPKAIDPPAGVLTLSPASVATMITSDQQPFTQTAAISLTNSGIQAFAYTITVSPGSLSPVISRTTGTLSPSTQSYTLVTLASAARPPGTYTATLTITATPGTVGAPTSIPLSLHVVDVIHPAYLAIARRQD